MKKYFVLGILFFLISNGIKAQELLPFVENFTKSDYNGDNQVWSNCQGSDNAMYFANNHYFLRYNGVKWEKYTLPNKTIIRSVYSDNNKIYCGSYNEFGFWERKSAVMVYTSLSNGKNYFNGISNNEEIWKIFKFKNCIYFQSFNQIYIYDGKNIEKLNLPNQITYCFPIAQKLYVATIKNGVYLLENKLFTKVKNWTAVENNIIHSIDVNRGKTYVFTRNNGIFVDKNGSLSAWNNAALNNNLKTELINTARFIDNDRLAIGTAFRGIYIVNIKDNTYVNIDRNNSLKNNSVLTVSLDKENDLWLGMDNGISHIEINSPYSVFLDNTGILGSVYSVAQLDNGFLLGTNHGVFEYENKKLHFVQGSQGQVWQIDKIGSKYIIGHNDGTFVYENNNLRKLNALNGGWKLLKSNYNNHYYQSNYSGIVVYDSDNFSQYKYIEGLTKPIRNISQKRNDELWAVDNYKSLYRIQLQGDKTVKVENITQINGIKNDFDVKLFNYKNEILFYIHNVWYQYNTISNKLEESKLFNDYFKDISGIIPIDDTSFLILKEGLLYVIHQKEEMFLWDLIPKKYYDGKIISDDTQVLKQDDKLIINLDDGFFIYSPKNSDIKNQKIAIEGFYEGKEITDDTDIKHNQSVEIDVITPFFGYKKPNLFYKLNNASFLPVETGNIILNNLNSGNQEVNLYYRNGDNYNEIGKYSFSVLRPWYFSIGIILLYIAIITGLFFLYYRWNKVRYTEKIKLKDEELKHQKAILQLEIEAENKLKIQEYEKHILEIQVQTKASEVAGKSLSIAKQSEMIESIQKLLEKENDITHLKNNIKKTIKLNSINKKEWETFENNLFKSHEDFVKRLTDKYPKLSSKDIKLCIYLKMSLSSKEIAPLMNISFRGVELHRYRLRKKLDIEQEMNLSGFVNTI